MDERDVYRAAAKRAWISAGLAGGLLLLLLMAGCAVAGLFILWVFAGAAS